MVVIHLTPFSRANTRGHNFQATARKVSDPIVLVVLPSLTTRLVGGDKIQLSGIALFGVMDFVLRSFRHKSSWHEAHAMAPRVNTTPTILETVGDRLRRNWRCI
jgi:hypothetical protein